MSFPGQARTGSFANALRTRLWLIEESRSHPDTTFVGFDVPGAQSHLQKTLPVNTELRSWDVYSAPPQDLKGTFDVVHLHQLAASAAATKAGKPGDVLDHLIELLKPEGILQWDELAAAELPLTYPPGQCKTAYQQLFDQMHAKTGSRPVWISELGSGFRERGLAVLEVRGGEPKKEMWKYWAQVNVGMAAEVVQTTNCGWELLDQIKEDVQDDFLAIPEPVVFVGRKGHEGEVGQKGELQLLSEKGYSSFG